jgi:hypothetical protein
LFDVASSLVRVVTVFEPQVIDAQLLEGIYSAQGEQSGGNSRWTIGWLRQHKFDGTVGSATVVYKPASSTISAPAYTTGSGLHHRQRDLTAEPHSKPSTKKSTPSVEILMPYSS